MTATIADFTNFADDELPLNSQWLVMAAALQGLASTFSAKIATGTEPADVLHGFGFGISGQSTTALDWRMYVDASNDLVFEENTNTDASPTWVERFSIASGGAGGLMAHASQHQHGGSDEVATATPGANAIPKAEASGELATGWIPDTELLDSQEFSAASTVDLVDSSGITADAYEVYLFNVTTSAVAVIYMLCSTDNGSSFDTTAKYTTGGGLSEWSNGTDGAEGILHVANTYPSATGLTIAVDVDDEAGYGANGVIKVQSAGVINGANMVTHYQGHVVRYPTSSSGDPVMLVIAGFYDGANGSRVNAFRIQASGGATMSGKMVLKRALRAS